MENKYFITTYGCQMNVHESEKLAGMMSELGYSEAKNQDEANLIVFNTCCIRENAEQHALGNIGALKSRKQKEKDLIICVVGCMTQKQGTAKMLKEKFPFIDIIIGTFNIDNFKNIITRKLKQKKTLMEILDEHQGVSENVKPFRTSFPNAWVNIMYGCNNFCTYCIVPYVRGRERSRDKQKIVDEVKSLVLEGYKEITLLGQNVDSYGSDKNEKGAFADLLIELDKIEGDYWIRFMSSHPKDINSDVLMAIKNSKHICHAIHFPIQAGSSSVLKAMNRKYTRENILEKIDMMKSIIPDIAITTDIMVGFPGETEQDFLDTLSICEKVNFQGAFTFVFSPRSGTKAYSMENQIDEEIKKDRIVRLVDFQNTKNRENSTVYINKIVKVLCENFDDKKNQYCGRDEYGKMVFFEADQDKIGKFVNVKVTEAKGIVTMGILQD